MLGPSGIYGSASAIPQFTKDSAGRVVGVIEVPIEITNAMLDAKFGANDWTIIGRSGGTWGAIVGSQPADGDPYMLPTITFDDGFYWNNFKSIFKQSFPATEGAILYGDGSEWLLLPPGSVGQVLKISGDVPVWGNVLSQINIMCIGYNPTDGQTVYIGSAPVAPTTVATQRRIIMNRSVTIVAAMVSMFAAAVGGTAENISIYIRVNNTTDHLIQTVGVAANQRTFSNTGLSIGLVAGDYIEIKIVQPTWVTNPTSVLVSGYITLQG